MSRIAREASARTAAAWDARVRKVVSQLEDFPEIGSPVEDAPVPGLRERVVGPYRIVYRFDGTNCLIVAFSRAEMDLGHLLDADDLP